MVMMRTVPLPGEGFERTYIPPGQYVCEIVEVKDTDKNGNRLTKTFKNRQNNEETVRDAIVLVMDIVEALPSEDDAGNWVVDDERMALVGSEVGKKMTDSLHEKAELHKVWKTVFNKPPVGSVDLDRFVGRKVVITQVDNSQYTPDGKFVNKSYVGDIAKYIPPQAAQAATRPKARPQRPAPPPPDDEEGDDGQPVPF